MKKILTPTALALAAVSWPLLCAQKAPTSVDELRSTREWRAPMSSRFVVYYFPFQLMTTNAIDGTRIVETYNITSLVIDRRDEVSKLVARVGETSTDKSTFLASEVRLRIDTNSGTVLIDRLGTVSERGSYFKLSEPRFEKLKGMIRDALPPNEG